MGEGAIISTARIRNIDGPRIEEGWNLVETDTSLTFPALIRKTAHQFEKILWIDSSNQAKTHYFESRPELLEKVSIARAFTALQHHQLCKNIGEYDLIVIPEIDWLYEESSLYRSEAVELFEDMLEALKGTVLYSTSGELGNRARDLKENTIEVESTDQGLKYSGSDSVTSEYYLKNTVQTTVESYKEVNREWEEPIRPTETV